MPWSLLPYASAAIGRSPARSVFRIDVTSAARKPQLLGYGVPLFEFHQRNAWLERFLRRLRLPQSLASKRRPTLLADFAKASSAGLACSRAFGKCNAN